MSYVKVFGSLLDSSVWQECLPTKIVWVTMLAMSNQDGEVLASVPGLARRAGVSIGECESALEAFLSPDRYSSSPREDGRRIRPIHGGWELINHDIYRQKLSAEDRRERTRKRVAKHRAKTGEVTPCNAEPLHVTPSNACNDMQNTSVSASASASASETVVLFDSVREGGAGGRDPIEVQAVTRWEVAKTYPVQQRAEWLVAQRHGQEHYSPSKWPEVVKAWEAYQEADGKPGARLGAWDKSTQAIVALYAAGHEQSTVCAGIRAVVKSEWWLKLQADGKRPGVGWISTEVFNRAMQGTDNGGALELARAQRARKSEQGVATLTASVEHTMALVSREDIKHMPKSERAKWLQVIETNERNQLTAGAQ